MERKWKLPVVICITVTYALSFLLMTLGYFTPMWAKDLTDVYSRINCGSAGLVSGWCRFDFTNSGTDVGDFGNQFIYLEDLEIS